MATLWVILLLVGFGTVITIGILWLYVRTPANVAFIRTGMGGKKVVIDQGAIVWPFVQHIQWISLETMKLEILREHKEAFITKDRYRVDIGAEFYVKVPPEPGAIERASRSLGEKSFYAEKIKQLVEEKLVAALRAEAARRDLVELHENRGGFAKAVMESLGEALVPNGLVLEEVSIFYLDQTPKEYLDSNNVFDAEGLRQITAQTMERLRERNEIERDTEVAIKRKDVEAVKLKLSLEQEQEFAEAEQRKQVEMYRAERTAEAEEFKLSQHRRVREAEIQTEQDIRDAELKREAYLIRQMQLREAVEIEKEQALEVAKRDKEIAILAKERTRLEEEQRRLESEAQREEAAQKVVTTAERLAAERAKELAVIQALQELDVTVKRAEASERMALAKMKEGEAEGYANRHRYEAENLLDQKIITRDILLNLIARAPQIVEGLMAPVSKIDSIRVVDFGGPRADSGAPLSAVSRLVGAFLEAGVALPLLKELFEAAKADPSQLVKSILDQLAREPESGGGSKSGGAADQEPERG